MRRGTTLFSALLLLLSGTVFPAENPPLASGYTAPDAPFRAGMWWNQSLDGSGMDIHLSGDRVFLVWYTYEEDGLPVWYLAEGDFSGEEWTAPLQRFTWDRVSGTAEGTRVGEVTLSFHGPTDATFGWTLGENGGSYPIEPLLVSEGISVYDRTGHWYPPGEPGYGLTVNNQGSVEFLVAYLYDQAGEPRWLWSDRTGELTQTHELVMFEGACPACPYEEPVPTAAGSLTRAFAGPRVGEVTIDARFPAPASGRWQRTGVRINILSNPQDGRNHPAAMAPFADAKALESYLKHGLAENPPRNDGGIDFSAGPSTPTFSQTTVQEAGVDEADTIKTDGNILYAVEPTNDSYDVRVLKLHPGSSSVTELARISNPGTFPRLRSLYLVPGDGESAPDLLIGLFYRDVFGEVGPPWYDSYDWLNQEINVVAWDVTNPASPETAWSLGLDGGMVETRRIGDTLYLVTRHTPSPPSGFDFHIGDPADVEANLETLQGVSLEELLPDFRVNGEKAGELVDPARTWLPPIVLDDETPNLVSVSAIDLRADSPNPEVLTIAGTTEAIYVSQDNLYLASSRYPYLYDGSNLVSDYPALVYTDIHKLALGAESPEYRGSASVEGHLGRHQDRKSFRMGEHQGALGVVTSADEMWGNLGDHRLTLLQETPQTPEHRLLREVAHLPNPEQPKTLGKPDEDLYATRFLDDRLYVVTFKKVDPLYVVDLANPSKPVIRGEVEVFGYSDFLFPVGPDLLLGVGKDAAPAEGPGDGRFAWYQGIRLGLFDVSDPADPRELDNVFIGRRGSWSPALYDHHAFSFLPATDNRPARFAIPAERHDTRPGEGISPDPSHYYSWVETGLYLFSVDTGVNTTPGLREHGGIFTAWYREGEQHQSHDSLHVEFSRSVITDDNAYFVKDGEIWSAPWDAPEQAIGPQ